MAPPIGTPSPPSGSSYRVQRAAASRPPASPPDATPPCSSEDDQADASTVEDQGEWQTFQNKSLGKGTV